MAMLRQVHFKFNQAKFHKLKIIRKIPNKLTLKIKLITKVRYRLRIVNWLNRKYYKIQIVPIFKRNSNQLVNKI